MAESRISQKRTRDDYPAGADFHGSKRQKPFDALFEFLDEEEEAEPSDELSAIFATFENEISPAVPPAAAEDGDSKLSVMRHLFEASDDELGIPNREITSDAPAFGSDELAFSVDDGRLWELEDEAANYYALLESQLFTGLEMEFRKH